MSATRDKTEKQPKDPSLDSERESDAAHGRRMERDARRARRDLPVNE